MSKHDIQQYFINITTEATCGRIQNKQLVELNREEKTTSRFSPKPWWIAAATFLFIAKPGFTQGATHSDHTARLNKKPKIRPHVIDKLNVFFLSIGKSPVV